MGGGGGGGAQRKLKVGQMDTADNQGTALQIKELPIQCHKQWSVFCPPRTPQFLWTILSERAGVPLHK